MEYLTIIGTGISIVISIIAIYVSWKKMKPEMKVLDSENEKNKAEIVEIYSEELRKLKEAQQKEREDNDRKMKELKDQFALLNIKFNQQIVERKEEQIKYREFINELLLGITKLTGQIQIKGEAPVWIPPSKTPFDC